MNLKMKKIIVCMLFAVMAIGAFAQEEGKIRGGLNIGAAIPDGGGGVCLDINLGYNLKDNMNVGIRWGTAGMAKVDPLGETGSVSANINFLGTYNYYFSSGTSPIAPFVGGGLGLYTVAAIAAGAGYTVDAGNRFGGMLTAGVEAGKFRLTLEYNIVPSSAVNVTSTPGSLVIKNDKIKNSYLGITAGFYIGGGKWKK